MRTRRVRVARCPHCGWRTRLQPKWKGEDAAISICERIECCAAFENSQVESWLEPPGVKRCPVTGEEDHRWSPSWSSGKAFCSKCGVEKL